MSILLYKLINERTLEQLAFEHEKADTEAEVTKHIYKSIEENDDNLEEERRLAYVGITRAKRRRTIEKIRLFIATLFNRCTLIQHYCQHQPIHP